MPNWRGNLAGLAVVAALSAGGAAMLTGQQATNDSMSTRSDTGMTPHKGSGKHHKSNPAKNGQGTTGAARTDTSGSSSPSGATNPPNPSSSSSSGGADTVNSGSKPPTGTSWY